MKGTTGLAKPSAPRVKELSTTDPEAIQSSLPPVSPRLAQAPAGVVAERRRAGAS